MSIEDSLRTIVREALAELLPPPAAPERRPALLDRKAIATELGVSVATVDRLCRDGMPFVRLGDSKRFELARVLEWARNR
jgi:hypothetical protein